jgi:hypothetical protein
MENKHEDEIRKRWEQEAKTKAARDEEAQQRPKKRIRAIEYQTASGIVSERELEEALGFATASGTTTKGRGAPKKKTGRAAAGKAKGKITEIIDDEEDMVVELD